MKIPSGSVSNPPGIQFGSTLIGKISESEVGKTTMQVKLKPGLGLYPIFFLTIFIGCSLTYKSLFDDHTRLSLFLTLPIIIVGPLFTIWFYQISNTALIERFKRLILKNSEM